jgi:hypothetical protein
MYKGFFGEENKSQTHHFKNVLEGFFPICSQEVLQDIPNGISIFFRHKLQLNFHEYITCKGVGGWEALHIVCGNANSFLPTCKLENEDGQCSLEDLEEQQRSLEGLLKRDNEEETLHVSNLEET